MIYDGLTGWHLLILAGVVLLLFGARRLPDAARALGQSLRIFRAETRELIRDTPTTVEAAAGPGDPPEQTPPAATPAQRP